MSTWKERNCFPWSTQQTSPILPISQKGYVPIHETNTTTRVVGPPCHCPNLGLNISYSGYCNNSLVDLPFLVLAHPSHIIATRMIFLACRSDHVTTTFDIFWCLALTYEINSKCIFLLNKAGPYLALGYLSTLIHLHCLCTLRLAKLDDLLYYSYTMPSLPRSRPPNPTPSSPPSLPHSYQSSKLVFTLPWPAWALASPTPAWVFSRTLLCIWHCSKSFTKVNSCNPHTGSAII